MNHANNNFINEYEPYLVNKGEFIGHGLDDNGKAYEGFLCADGKIRFYYYDGKEYK